MEPLPGMAIGTGDSATGPLIGEVMTEGNGASRLDRIESSLETLVGVVASHTSQIATLLDHGLQTNEILQRTAEEQLKLAEAQLKLAEAHNKLAEAHNKLEAAQLETTEKLDALIRIADEWIRNRPQGSV